MEQREQWTAPSRGGNICQTVVSQNSLFERIWSFIILLCAVSKDLAPQTGIINLIFLKDDYCIQFKCSKHFI